VRVSDEPVSVKAGVGNIWIGPRFWRSLGAWFQHPGGTWEPGFRSLVGVIGGLAASR
jgi:hypothetical protein